MKLQKQLKRKNILGQPDVPNSLHAAYRKTITLVMRVDLIII